jgi:hypothetical protein
MPAPRGVEFDEHINFSLSHHFIEVVSCQDGYIVLHIILGDLLRIGTSYIYPSMALTQK